jgi:tetratricopeptide (TPR) repeat protein
VDAIRAYGKLIELDSDKPLYYYRLADLLNDVGQYDKALRTIRTGRQYDTECSAHAHAVSGRALEKTGEYKKAEREYRKCVECNDPTLSGYCTAQIERQQQLAEIESAKKAKAKQGY